MTSVGTLQLAVGQFFLLSVHSNPRILDSFFKKSSQGFTLWPPVTFFLI
jgi:hypothetical protein